MLLQRPGDRHHLLRHGHHRHRCPQEQTRSSATAVQKALQALITDGTYAQILNKYNEGSLAVTSALVNQGK